MGRPALFMLLRAAASLVVAMTVVSACNPRSAVTPSASPKARPSSAPLFAWAYEGTVRINAVDPRTVVLTDGSYRQIYGSWRSWQPITGGPGARGLDVYAATAVSKDGLHWTDEGKLDAGYLVPVRLLNGRYRGYSDNLTAFVSDDARTWSLDTSGPVVPPEPVGPCHYSAGDVAVMPDQTLRYYYNCSAGQANPACQPALGFCLGVNVIDSATSKDGLVWQKDPGVRIDPRNGPEFLRDQGGNVVLPGDASHPRVVTVRDGSLEMFYWGGNETWSATSVDGLTWTNRKYEGVFGSDPDVIVLPDGRTRLFVNGFLGLPQDFDGKTLGENQRIVSYVYGPVRYRVSVDPDRVFNGICSGCPGLTAPVPPPEYVNVKIEGSGPEVTLSAIGYSVEGDALHASNPRVIDLVTDPAGPVQVEFSPSSGSPPFTTRTTLTLRNRLGASIVLVANNGGSQELIPLRQSLPPTPGQPASLRPTCQVGRPVGPQGCTVPGQTGPDGTPLTCLPPDQAASSPPICKRYY